MAALDGSGPRPVATNGTGANMPAGHVAALVGAPPGAPAVLEVDEGYLGRLMVDTRPGWWSSSTSRGTSSTGSPRSGCWSSAGGRRWPPAGTPAAGPGGGGQRRRSPGRAGGVGRRPGASGSAAGQVWRHDAVGCPACEGRIVFGEPEGWACERCGFARPAPDARVDGSVLVLADGSRHSARHRPAGPLQPVQRGHGRRGRHVGRRGGRSGRRRARRRGAVRPRADLERRRGGRTVLVGRPARSSAPAPAGQEPGGMGGRLRPPRRGGHARVARRAVHQRPDRRRVRHQLALGRALRAPVRPPGGGDRGPAPRPGRAAALRRGRPRRGGRPGGGRRPGHRPGDRGALDPDGRPGSGAPTVAGIDLIGNYTAFADLRSRL